MTKTKVAGKKRKGRKTAKSKDVVSKTKKVKTYTVVDEPLPLTLARAVVRGPRGRLVARRGRRVPSGTAAARGVGRARGGAGRLVAAVRLVVVIGR